MNSRRRARLPLYLKILAWFFLNLVLLGAVMLLLFNVQFRVDLDWVFVTSARERVESMRRLITDELNSTPTYEWETVLERFSSAYGVRFALLDDEGNPLVGLISNLPVEVKARILQRGNPEPSGERHPEMSPHWHGPPLRVFIHSHAPAGYWLLLSVRLDNPQAGEPLHAILAAESSSLSEGGLIFDLKPWLIFGAGAAIFSGLFWLPLVSGITRVIGQMTHATQQIAEGRFDVRVAGRRRDELGSLGDAINQMATRLDGFVRGQKRFLGDIAHELCSPLARLQMALGILEQRAGPDAQNYVKAAGEKAAQISTLVNELLAFSKASFGAPAIHLQSVNVLEIAETAARHESIEPKHLRLEIPDQLCAEADPELLVRALSNLLRNCVRHAGQSEIAISAAAQNEDVTITVADSGPGVSSEELLKIFDAFYRVDPSRARETGGSGLGLTIVKTCVESCGGSVLARNRATGGLEIVIRLRGAVAVRPLVPP